MFESWKRLLRETGKPQILSPIEGKAVPMSRVSDPMFSQEILGKGAAVIPAVGRAVAPVDGEVTVVFETGHAIGIRSSSGAEIVIHVGLDTVNLKGRFFTPHVKVGDQVKAGDLMLEFDISGIGESGYDLITPVLVTNVADFPNMKCHTDREVKELDPLIDL